MAAPEAKANTSEEDLASMVADLKKKIDPLKMTAVGKRIATAPGISMPDIGVPLGRWSSDIAGDLSNFCHFREYQDDNTVEFYARHVVATAIMDSMVRGAICKVKVHCPYAGDGNEVVAKLRECGYDAKLSKIGWRIVIDLNNVVGPDGIATRATEPAEDRDKEYDSEAELSD